MTTHETDEQFDERMKAEAAALAAELRVAQWAVDEVMSRQNAFYRYWQDETWARWEAAKKGE